jgi:hypothetical protein
LQLLNGFFEAQSVDLNQLLIMGLLILNSLIPLFLLLRFKNFNVQLARFLQPGQLTTMMLRNTNKCCLAIVFGVLEFSCAAEDAMVIESTNVMRPGSQIVDRIFHRYVECATNFNDFENRLDAVCSH